MEKDLIKGFCEMSQDEIFMVEGGDILAETWNEVCKGLTQMSAGAIAGAKVGAATCTPAGIVTGVVVGAVVGVVWDNIF